MSDGARTPLNHLVKSVKPSRWVQIDPRWELIVTATSALGEKPGIKCGRGVRSSER